MCLGLPLQEEKQEGLADLSEEERSDGQNHFILSSFSLSICFLRADGCRGMPTSAAPCQGGERTQRG